MTPSLEKKLMALAAKAQQWLKAYATLPPDLQAEKKQEMEQLQQLVTAHQALLGGDKPSQLSQESAQLLSAYKKYSQQIRALLAS